MLKTLEALIAIVLSLVFVILVFSKLSPPGISEPALDTLLKLEELPEFRNCAAAGDFQCLYYHVNSTLSIAYRFHLDVSPVPLAAPLGLPESGVYSESVMISGNISHYSPNIIRLYYWRRAASNETA